MTPHGAQTTRATTREIVVKPRDVMPEGARTLPARFYTERRVLRPRDRGAVPDDVDLRRAGRGDRDGRASSCCARSPATASSSRRRPTAACTRSTTSAGIAARACAPRRRDVSPAASSARITPGPTVSTAGCSARRTWTKCRTSARRTIRCTRVHADVWDGHVFLNLSRAAAAALARSSPIFRASFARGAWRICGSATASSTTSRPTGS